MLHMLVAPSVCVYINPLQPFLSSSGESTLHIFLLRGQRMTLWLCYCEPIFLAVTLGSSITAWCRHAPGPLCFDLKLHFVQHESNRHMLTRGEERLGYLNLNQKNAKEVAEICTRKRSPRASHLYVNPRTLLSRYIHYQFQIFPDTITTGWTETRNLCIFILLACPPCPSCMYSFSQHRP